MASYGGDFMGRVRGMWDRFSGREDHGRQQMHGYDRGFRPPMGATGPGGEGYFLSPDMAHAADSRLDYADRGWDDLGDRGFMPGGVAQFGRAGAGRGYGGDYRTGRGGYDRDEFFANRAGGGTGYRSGYVRDQGMPRGGQAGRGYGAEYTHGGFATGYDRGYRGGHIQGSRNDYQDMGEGLRSYYSGTYREGGVIGQSSTQGGRVPPADREHEGGRHNRTPPPRPYGR